MRLSKASRVILLLFSHVSATLMPNLAGPLIGSTNHDGLDQKLHPESNTGIFSSANILANLFARQNNNNDSPSCQRCKKCSNRFIQDEDNCRRCVRCPKGQKGNSDRTRCIPQTWLENKEELYQKKKKIMKREYKKRVYDKKKGEAKRDWDRRERERIDNKNRIKVRFMGRCLTLVPLALGGEFASEFAGEYFDEAFLEHYGSDMLEHWPEDLEVAPWFSEEDVDDGVFAEDEFVEKFVEYGNDNNKRWLNNLDQRDLNASLAYSTDEEPDVVSSSDDGSMVHSPAITPVSRNDLLPYDMKQTDLIVRDNNLEERFFWLIPILRGILATVKTVLKVAKDTVKVASGKGSKNSYKKQPDGFGKIAREGKDIWRNCLKKQGP